ncbi:MAG: phosphoribosylanthranilate isomerase, partial [Phycisphaerae bacterium]
MKIEGLRDPATAMKIAQMGADAIGVVFADSPRWVSPEQARAIVDVLPPWVATVGVFVNADAATINRVVERTGISMVQLHGEEPPEIVAQLAAPAIKAFRVRDESWLAEARHWVGECDARRNLKGIL